MIAARSGPGCGCARPGRCSRSAPCSCPAPAAALVHRRPGGGLLAWAADQDSAGLRRGLQAALGVVWLADGALQLQPIMFTRGFVTQILLPATMGNPAGVSGPAMAFGRLVLHDPAGWDAAFAVTQLLLGAGLLWRRTVRAALAASIGWALAVWWFGEGLGGVLSGIASPLTGAPGAVILYALLAVLLWPGRGPRPGARRRGQPAAAPAGRLAWLVLWASSAYFLLQPATGAPLALHNAVAGLATGEPGWRRRPTGPSPARWAAAARPSPSRSRRPAWPSPPASWAAPPPGPPCCSACCSRWPSGWPGRTPAAVHRSGHRSQLRPAADPAGRGVLASEAARTWHRPARGQPLR